MQQDTLTQDTSLVTTNSQTTLLVVIVIGFFGGTLFDGSGLGLNATLFSLVIALVYTLRYMQSLVTILLIPFALFFIAALSWRDSKVLFILNICGLLATIIFSQFQRSFVCNKNQAPLRWLANIALWMGLYSVTSVPKVFYQDLRGLDRIEHFKQYLPRIFAGVLYALPFLLVFSALFISSDQRYSEFVYKTLTFDSGVWNFAFWTLISMIITIPLLRGRFSAETALKLHAMENIDSEKTQDAPKSAAIEICSFLVLINSLFASFIYIQFSYFFGDATLVAKTVGLTYADYARKGFFELTAVAAIVLLLLWFLTAKIRSGGTRGYRTFALLAALMIVMTIILIFSALDRMGLYTHTYGLTELRLYITALLYLMLFIFVLFVTTLLVGRELSFITYGFISILATIVVLNIASPDAIIARENLSTGKLKAIDVDYNARLSRDAYPELLQYAITRNDAPSHNIVCLMQLHYQNNPQSWRVWSWSTHVAASAYNKKGLTCAAL